MKPKRALKQQKLEKLRRGREARMKKLEDKFSNEPNIQEQDTKILSDIPEQPIKQETPVVVQETPVVVQETPVVVQETETPEVQETETPETPKSRRKRLALDIDK